MVALIIKWLIGSYAIDDALCSYFLVT